MNFTFAPDFTYRYFDSILNVIKKSFELRLIGEGLNETTTRPQLFLRHDVDVSLKSALKLAEVEYQHEVRATYMVIPDSRLYNLHSYDTRRALDLLRNMKHEVALHFDLDQESRLLNLGPDDVAEKIDQACRMMEDVTGVPVRSVSFHRPTQRFLWGPTVICGRINAYSKDLMANYISDSKGQFDISSVARLQADVGAINQLLIHPIWWGAERLSPEERLEEFFENETHGQPLEVIAALDANLALTVPGVRRRANATPN